MERTGWWFWIERLCLLNLNNHPVCGIEVAIATFVSTPQPLLLARRGDRPLSAKYVIALTKYGNIRL
jgi:hypothetical protein